MIELLWGMADLTTEAQRCRRRCWRGRLRLKIVHTNGASLSVEVIVSSSSQLPRIRCREERSSSDLGLEFSSKI